ncbi:MAG: hypothetical protein IT236_12145, partial [Bacteroidia bacterium]|nr:hypothetical protein [Bacteroidia bacterium]
MNNEEKFKHKLKDLLDEQDFPYSPANWDKASAVLDKEDKRKRRFLFWLFTGLGVGLSLFGILFYMNNSKAATANTIKKNTDSTLAVADKHPNQMMPPANSSKDEPEKTNPDPQTPPSKTKASNAGVAPVQQPMLNATPQPITKNTKPETVTAHNSGLATAPTIMQANAQPSNTKKIKNNPPKTFNENNATIVATKTNNETTKSTPKPDTLLQTKTGVPASPEAPIATGLPGSTPSVSSNNQASVATSEPENSPTQIVVEEKEPTPSPKNNATLISELPLPQTIPANHFFYVEAGAYYNTGWTINSDKEAAAVNPMAGITYFT